jgi:2-aminobenzoate-CoA ligase
MDEDGYVFFKARTDDLIISSGHNIGAPEVEAAVLTHPDVAECAVVGLPDEERGQVVKAFVVTRPQIELSPRLAEEIIEFVKSKCGRYQSPREIQFVDSLPKTHSGKIQRFLLRQSALEGKVPR